LKGGRKDQRKEREKNLGDRDQAEKNRKNRDIEEQGSRGGGDGKVEGVSGWKRR